MTRSFASAASAPIVLAMAAAACGVSGQPARQAPGLTSPAVAPFAAPVYGASGVAQLQDGRLIVAGDDQYNPLTVIDLFGSGASRTFTTREISRALGSSGAGSLNDLEALTTDPRGHVYAATSHALTAKSVAKPSREQLVRFDVTGSRLADVRVTVLLKPALIALDPLFATAAAEEPHEHGGLNIEGLAWDPVTSRLLIGFRSPRRHRHALVVWLTNPDAVFDRGEAPALSPPIGLDLDGEGVRDVTYSPTLNSFVIVAGTWRRGKHTPTTLWSWEGHGPPVKLRAPDFEDLNPEGITEVTAQGARALLIVSDDGNGDELFSRGRALQEHAVSSRYAILPAGTVTRAGAAQ